MARSCKMTKMHFELIAEVINTLDLGTGKKAAAIRQGIAYRFAHELVATNESFDVSRFMDAATWLDNGPKT